MDGEQKTAIIPLVNSGVQTKFESSKIPPGGFQYLSNIVTEQEGSITTRRGRYAFSAMPVTFVHSYAKMVVAAGEVPGKPWLVEINPRYIGQGADIWRTLDFGSFTSVNAVPVCSDPGAGLSRFWTMAPYAAGASGNPFAFFACELAMLKDKGNPVSPYTPEQGALEPWGIPPAFGVAIADFGAGNPDALDGGATGSPAGSAPYRWVYTFQFLRTGNEGNPSLPMNDDSQVTPVRSDGSNVGSPIAVHEQEVTVTGYGIGSGAVAALYQIVIYRTGGILTDGIYRRVGYVANPGLGNTWSFTDKFSDSEILLAPQLETDNDPPVVSTVREPLWATLDGAVTPGRALLKTNAMANGDGIFKNVLPGTTVNFTEPVVVDQVVDQFQAYAYCQFGHPDDNPLSINAITGQPCNLCATAFDLMFVAGDPNNPHILYKSKSGRPESFPLMDASGVPGTLGIGTPSDPIVDFCQLPGGQILCMNAQHFYEVSIFNGAMYGPNPTGAQRGLLTKGAWCLADNEIWYLAYDGIWSWDGGVSTKRSELIDEIFHNQVVTTLRGQTFHPIDLDPAQTQFTRLEYYRNRAYVVYRDLTGTVREIFWDTLHNRWQPGDKNIDTVDRMEAFLYREKDTNNLLYFRQDPTGAVICLDDMLDDGGLTSDEWVVLQNGAGGTPITFEVITGWLDLGNPYMVKVFDEVFLDVEVPGDGSANALQVDVYFDYAKVPTDNFVIPSDAPPTTVNISQASGDGTTAVYTYTVATGPGLAVGQLITVTGAINPYFNVSGRITAVAGGTFSLASIGMGTEAEAATGTTYATGRKWLALDLNLLQDAFLANLSTYARQASVIAFGLRSPTVPLAGYRPIIYGVKLKYREVGEIAAGPVWDWNDLGWKYDKRLHEFTVTFDTNDLTWTLVMDTISGIQGNVETDDVMVFSITNPVILGPGRAQCTFPIYTDIIAKMVRIRALPPVNAPGTPATTFFRILNIDWQKVDYPADTLLDSEWETGGFEYLKYANQLDFNVDTNNVEIPVKIQADGVTVYQILVKTTMSDRQRNFTLPPNLGPGRIWRWLIDVCPFPFQGKFQVFHHAFKWQKYDEGEVVHSKDYDDLGHRFDKRLRTLTVTWQNNITWLPDNPPGGNFDVQLQLDLLSGIDGGTLQSAVATFDLGSNVGRHKKTWPLPYGLVCKYVRLYPITNPLPWGFQQWHYEFEFEPFPADRVYFQEPKDFGYQHEKLARNLTIRMNTSGTDCTVQLIGDNTVRDQFMMNTDLDDIRRVFPVRANQLARMWRLEIIPDPNGRSQLWDWDLDYLKEPPYVYYWIGYEDVLGYRGWKAVKQAWLDYVSPNPVPVAITSDTGTYTITLPAHNRRLVERFYLPMAWGSGLNKSKTYTIVLNGTSTPSPPPLQGAAANLFKFYPESSGLEWWPIAPDRRQAYQQTPLSEWRSFQM